MVVAIDFGTTFSGYAFQFTKEYGKEDPTKSIFCPQSWNGGKKQLISLKTPTCLLLDQNTDIDCFGYEAEEKYANLCMDGDNKDWYFFRRFKLQLLDTKELTLKTPIADETGKKLPAIDVFSKSIECLKNHLKDLLLERNITLKDHEALWVLTVPAIWDDTAKGFMRQAAKNAGIPLKHLKIALEPEAASLYCQYLPVERLSVGSKMKFSDASIGTTYMIVDLGGGTADITVHKKIANGKLKEMKRASGGPWGGTAIDGAFIKLLGDIIGGPVFAAFMKEQSYDYLDFMRDFETVKRNLKLDSTDSVNIKLPASLHDTCRNMMGKDFKQLVKDAKKDKLITFVGDKMKIDPDTAKGLFRKATDKIVGHIKRILQEDDTGKEISLILMVGGFSESPFVQDVIKKEFQDKMGKKVLVPNEAGISVLNGAVVFGRQPENIASRVLRFTYGAKVTPIFRPGFHDIGRKFITDGKERCDNVFSTFIATGTQVELGHTVQEKYKTLRPFQSEMTLEIFVTEDASPSYTDEPGCRFLGKLNVDVPHPSAENHSMDVIYEFGDTELHITALEEDSSEPCVCSLKMFE